MMSLRIFCYLCLIGLVTGSPAIAQFSGGSAGPGSQQARTSSFPDVAFLEGRFNGDPEALILRNRSSQSVVLFEHDDLFDWDKINYSFPSMLVFGAPVSAANVIISDRDNLLFQSSQGQKQVKVTYYTTAPYAQVVAAVLNSTGLKNCYSNSRGGTCNTARNFKPAVVGRTGQFETRILVIAPPRPNDKVEIEVTYPATFLPKPAGEQSCC